MRSRFGRAVSAVLAVLAVLVIANLIQKYGPEGSGLVLGPAVAVVLVVLARRAGLTWEDLGLARATWAKGIAYAIVAAVVVAAALAVAAALPSTRSAFLDVRYQMPVGTALVTALVNIPLRTVLMEEIAFRGVLLGLVTRHYGIGWGYAISSALFGLWHVLPSIGLGRANAAVGAVTGAGGAAEVGVVLAAVVFTGMAGLLLAELRRRSGSLIAPIGVHWASNGIAVLVVAWVYGP